jgi:hypothetical protein
MVRGTVDRQGQGTGGVVEASEEQVEISEGRLVLKRNHQIGIAVADIIAAAGVDAIEEHAKVGPDNTDPVGPVGLLKRHRSLLEAIASEKYDQESATEGLLHLTEDDLRATRAAEGCGTRRRAGTERQGACLPVDIALF